MTTDTEVEALVIKPRANSAGTVSACAWPALFLAAVCLLPFLKKPFLIDDAHFLTMAQQIVKHPTHPMDFTICWNTPGTCTKAYLLTPSDALMGYVLVPTVMSGAHEWMAHLTQLVLCWMAIVAMASLILRFGWDRWHARVGALLLAAIPPFLPMAATAMPDILATALAVVGIERLAAWKAEEKWGQGAAAAVALGLAGFARPHLALLLPLAAFFLLESTNPRDIWAQFRRKAWIWTPVVAGSALLIGVILAVREHNLAINPPPLVTGWGHILLNLPAYLLYFVFPLPLAACWLVSRWRRGQTRLIVILSIVALAVALIFYFANWDHPVALFLAVVGGGAICSMLWEILGKHDHTGLFLLLWILIPLPIIFYEHLPMKYVLPCVPAVILLCFRLMDGVSVRVTRAAAVALIVASTGYSLLILRSDAEFAQFGRDALHSLIAPHVAAGETVWFPGQYWSYWYAPLDGAKLTFPGGPQPKPGDLLVVDVFGAGKDAPLSRFPHRTLVETISHKYRFGRTMGAGIGLYSNAYGFWLWGFGESKKDRFELWRID